MPQKFTDRGNVKSPFVDYDDKGNPMGVLTDNTPIRIYIGYGDNPPRRFTGLIDGVDISENGDTINIRCTDMMKKIINMVPYIEEHYPPDTQLDGRLWLATSIIGDLAMKAGMNKWRTTYEDMNYPDMYIEESYYTDIRMDQGFFVKIDFNTQEKQLAPINKLPVDGGYLNPFVYPSTSVKPGQSYGEIIDSICHDLNYWHRCDTFGTFKCTPIRYSENTAAYFKDYETIISVNKTIDYSKMVNHIIMSGGETEESFFDDLIFKQTKGERRTARVENPSANTYGKKLIGASKLFNEMRMMANTVQAVIEGNPYLELMDTVNIEHAYTTTNDRFVVKGMKDTWSEGNPYVTTLDLFWYGVVL